MKRLRTLVLAAVHFAIVSAMPAIARAAGGVAYAGGMPWETPLNRIQASITGPTAKALVLIAFAITGVAVMFSEGGSLLRSCFKVAFGAVIALGAGQWALTFFGFGGGLSL
jgi:type IV secretion system protein TrbC